ncbi:uncharacterized protein LOC115630518 [Scaptodrosophila lebanonensis]|uniref:Uncharacterized protein LOC115630518 n=1 Tax=Drosophila lebanonensis TaxID=7225 RepID=A0A6J2U4W9_DROLE|nr:uncharacterized protein LOC115630518 [Scaptodrosophila lebanonensis]
MQFVCGNSRSMLLAVLLPSLLALTLVAAVPASVLAQNTELSTQQQQQQQHEDQAAEKKAEDATVPPADKKSSPEIVPASFSNAPPAKSLAKNNHNNNQQQRQPVPEQQQAGIYALPTNEEILAAVASAAQNNQFQEEASAAAAAAAAEDVGSTTLRKRGVNYDYNPYAANDYGPYSAPGYGSNVPNGVWANDYEPTATYNENDLQDLDDYVPERHVSNGNGRNKAYDNLQNLLNAEAYLESIPLSVPLQYANRNYGLADDRNKRGIYYNMDNAGENLNKFRRYGDLRLKRDTTKLTPADMLALVALVEAGERARKETDADNAAAVGAAEPYGPKTYENEDLDYVGNVGVPPGNWLDAPALVDYYGMPVNVETMPKYEYLPRQHKYGNGINRFGSSKRYMVKKKRSISPLMNEPMADRGSSYNGEKYY